MSVKMAPMIIAPMMKARPMVRPMRKALCPVMTTEMPRNVTVKAADGGVAGALAGASAVMIRSQALLPVISQTSRRMLG